MKLTQFEIVQYFISQVKVHTNGKRMEQYMMVTGRGIKGTALVLTVDQTLRRKASL